MIKGIIFDLDDTLLQTKQTKYQALKETGRKFYDLTITDEQLSSNWGKPFSEFMGIIFNHVEAIETIIINYKSVLPNFPNKPYDDAIATINKLIPNYKLGILSSASKYLVYNDLTASGFNLNQFLYIQSEDDTAVHKPDPNVFKPILEIYNKQNIQPHEILFSGDTISDCQASTGAGLQFIGMAGRTATKQDFDKLSVKSVNSLTELFNQIATI
jgi:phosphoglycolate phosphatase-like HAD superfamily hydrolase